MIIWKRQKKMKINRIWEELENDTSLRAGFLFRRYSASLLQNLFIAMKVPEKLRCIAVLISKCIKVNLSSFSYFKDIRIEVISDEQEHEKNILIVQLFNNQYKDIFSVLCEDLILNISNVEDEEELARELLNRIEKWKSLFDKVTSQGLTYEEQIGLYGELYFMRQFLQSSSVFLNVVNSWIGPEKQIRDFQSGTWSIEVKSTHGNNHQKLYINSERQLDTNNIENLFLYHISLDVRQQSGETLNQIVDAILEILNSDFVSLNQFKSKLFNAGYFDQHRHLYETTGYFVRHKVFYQVENDFPRIEERDIRNGVGDVKYSIILSNDLTYIRTEKQIFKIIVY